MTPLWTVCAHGGLHVVDLTWQGAITILASAAAGGVWGFFVGLATHKGG